jgi:hypothetical protein
MTRVLPTWNTIPVGGNSDANTEYFALCLDGVVQNMLSFDLVNSALILENPVFVRCSKDVIPGMTQAEAEASLA